MAASDFDYKRYMPCPGPRVNGVLTETCRAIIPREIVCTNANEGKKCRRCDTCSYFSWWPEYEEYDSAMKTVHSPTRSLSLAPMANVNSPLGALSPGCPRITHSPAPGSTTPQTTAPALRPPPLNFVAGRQNPTAKKPRCSSSPCTRQMTASCTNAMCKTCCIRSLRVCMYKNHNDGRRPVSTSDDPFHMPRPIPALPLIPNTAASTPVSTPMESNYDAAGGALNPFHFGKPVPPLLALDYNRRRQERETRQALEASRAENERRIRHAVLLVAYLSESSPPTFLPLQDIKTWPTLNLRSLPHLLSQLGLDDTASLELYVSTGYGSFWVSTLDYSMTVKTDQQVFIRLKGIPTSQHASTMTTSFSMAAESPRTPSKRVRATESLSSTPEHTSKRPRILDSFDLNSGSPSFVSSVSPLLFTSNLADHVSLESDVVDEHDLLWALGSVLTPSIDGVKWPRLLYARDVAQGFAFLKDATASDDLPIRFSRVFNGMLFKNSTYHVNRNFWDRLPEDLKQEGRNHPRTPDGLWTAWRKGKPGWGSTK